ncbi:IclR family transcriptional regulator [Azospirillum picis]|uniref:DNA-binding IclR family transcriptional regulator n=1 Tax=Azospirillum picis TaxID=488438 RepID=A0ABU0MTC5_9PROT|nr:IclR family transcriptional regulator [Azospirillum picis]MBP2302955.1 DNA-binding IclR family transcriptional regulator [Azospirillum picis]MDQ0536707.1 DNA-binding IclR family transcriptional regulator [Azospirillum picis]
METEESPRDRRGIQSIEVGGQLLLALARSGAAMVLRDLAREAGMTAAKAHPYLVSFGKLGLVEQDPVTGRYDLGPQALQLGLVGLQRLDPLRIATKAVGELSARIGHSVAIAVWGSHGPTIVRVEESSYPLHVNLRTGSVMSLLNTATGLVFAAFMPAKLVEACIADESGRSVGNAGGPRPDWPAVDWPAVEATLAEVRRRGLARAVGLPIPGINAFSAPVFDHSRNIALVITAIGPSGTFDVDWDSPLAAAVAASAEAVSRRLGYLPAATPALAG